MNRPVDCDREHEDGYGNSYFHFVVAVHLPEKSARQNPDLPSKITSTQLSSVFIAISVIRMSFNKTCQRIHFQNCPVLQIFTSLL